MRYMSQHAYETTEKHVGRQVVRIRDEAIKEAMDEEKALETETYTTEKYGTLPAITLSVDKGWNKKGSGCTYNSATGTMNAIGVRTKKVCWSETLCNKCMYCDRLKKVRK